MGVQVKECKCPECGKLLDAATGIQSQPEISISMTNSFAPVPGDFSVCIQCGTILRFNEKMQLIIPDSLDELDPEQIKYLQNMSNLIKLLDAYEQRN